MTDEDGAKSYGLVSQLKQYGWSKSIEKTYVSSISQEHGIINASASFCNKVKVGDLIVILPVHSYLTVNLLKEFTTLDGLKFKTM